MDTCVLVKCYVVEANSGDVRERSPRHVVGTAVLTRVEMAATLARQYGLRGCDAVHLALASFWREIPGQVREPGPYDQQLWETARVVGLDMFPEERP
jgi:hypothetical protein